MVALPDGQTEDRREEWPPPELGVVGVGTKIADPLHSTSVVCVLPSNIIQVDRIAREMWPTVDQNEHRLVLNISANNKAENCDWLRLCDLIGYSTFMQLAHSSLFAEEDRILTAFCVKLYDRKWANYAHAQYEQVLQLQVIQGQFVCLVCFDLCLSFWVQCTAMKWTTWKDSSLKWPIMSRVLTSQSICLRDHTKTITIWNKLISMVSFIFSMRRHLLRLAAAPFNFPVWQSLVEFCFWSACVKPGNEENA